jgi:leucyl aminopeptidase
MSAGKSLTPDVKISHGVPSLKRIPADHVLVLLAKGLAEGKVLGRDIREGVRSRGRPSPGSEADALTATIDGKLVVWAEFDPAGTVFQQQTAIRKALELLLKEFPRELALVIQCEGSDGRAADEGASHAVYVAAVNSRFNLCKQSNRKESAHRPLQTLHVYGVSRAFSTSRALATAEGNLLARSFTLRPPNDLTPKRYRSDILRLAKAEGWKHRAFDFKSLKKMGAGAFCAVAQGSPHQDAAIVHLSYLPKGPVRRARAISLVGKGICMDTGGHGLKTAKGMYGMHEDMNGSAVALGILKAASDLKLPLAIDVWLAIAQNHIGPDAYQPGDVVTALDGTTIEVVHTDAEGRMVLADALTLAARSSPDLIVDFATLTGAMVHSLGTRMSGVFSNRSGCADLAVGCGRESGERVTLFPLEADYDAALDSKLADV